jgi:hypothetical protein
MTIEGTMSPNGSHPDTTFIGVGCPDIRAWRSGLSPNLVDLMVNAMAAAKTAIRATVTDVLLTGRNHISLDGIIRALAVRRRGSIAQFDRAAAVIADQDLGRFAGLPMVVGGDTPAHAGELRLPGFGVAKA